MITLYQYLPAWTVPCISPYVTGGVLHDDDGVNFDTKPQDLTRLDKDTPTGKLPCIVDTDGTAVNDSTHIIEYLQGKYGDAIDEGASLSERAQMLAFNRMIDEQPTGWRHPAALARDGELGEVPAHHRGVQRRPRACAPLPTTSAFAS